MTEVDGGGVPAGTQLNGIYEIEKRIAMGGMGEVYTGKLVQTGDKVAIKMILPEHANNELILDLFRKEASTLHNLYHEAIVRYYVFSVDPVLNRVVQGQESPRPDHAVCFKSMARLKCLHGHHKRGVINPCRVLN